MYILLGSLSFLLYFLYDLNQTKQNLSFFKPLFALASILLSFSTFMIAYGNMNQFKVTPIWRIFCVFLAILNILLLIYTLFFAIDFDKTYVNNEFIVCDTGMYALSRHPGLLWFIFSYLFTGLAIGSYTLLFAGALFSIFNFLYIFFQDLYVFPKVFKNYEQYKKSTPFLLFNKNSLHKCLITIKGGHL